MERVKCQPHTDQREAQLSATGLDLGTAGLRWGKQNGPQPCRPLPHPQLSPGSEEDEAHEGCSRENLGRIQFSVGYNFQESTLTVKIMKAQELPAKDFSGTSDPFVKIYLLPDKKHKLETKVKRKNLNPHWNETFLFEGEVGATPPRLPSSSLLFSHPTALFLPQALWVSEPHLEKPLPFPNSQVQSVRINPYTAWCPGSPEPSVCFPGTLPYLVSQPCDPQLPLQCDSQLTHYING